MPEFIAILYACETYAIWDVIKILWISIELEEMRQEFLEDPGLVVGALACQPDGGGGETVAGDGSSVVRLCRVSVEIVEGIPSSKDRRKKTETISG